MTLEELIQTVTQNSDHFIDDPDQPGGVRGVTHGGGFALTLLRSVAEDLGSADDNDLLQEAAGRCAEAGYELQEIAASIPTEWPEAAESALSTSPDDRTPFDV